MSKCIVCGKELYDSKSLKCRECTLKELPVSYCNTCGSVLSPEQVRRGFRYCSHACHGNSSQAKEAGIYMNEKNRVDSPWWNYKNFIRYPENKEHCAFLYVVDTERGIKVGITSYFYKRIEEVTRTDTDRTKYFIHTVQFMPTLDAAYLESYIHKMFPHENEYHRVEDCIEICKVINNPRSWTLLNHLRDDRNPDLQYPHREVFKGTYGELEMEFILRTGECNLSKWTVGDYKKELYQHYLTIENSLVKDPQPEFDEDRLFELHDGLITHNCRLRLDMRELSKRYGGLFGSGDSTGSIGVVTINLPRIAYVATKLSRNEQETDKDVFYSLLSKYMDLAKESLEIKRNYLQKHILDAHLLPAFEEYVGTLNNHFSTIGLIGMNEMCINLLGKDILDEKSHEFCLEVLDYMREKLSDYQESTGNLYNLEATPAESTSYRLAKIDKKEFGDDIFTQGPSSAPYYTNSCHIPVNSVKDINSLFEHQNDLQTKFTGGTVIHLYLEGPISGSQAKHIIKTVMNKYSAPYVSISPLTTICPNHGLLTKSCDKCPECGAETDMYQRITGYIRNVKYFNPGKKSEFSDRNQITIDEIEY